MPPPSLPSDSSDDRRPPSPVRAWLQRIGVAGFVFFLVKGILWLLIPGFLVTSGIQCGGT